MPRDLRSQTQDAPPGCLPPELLRQSKPDALILYFACTLRVASMGLVPNVQDEPRPWLARLVLLGARGVTAMVAGSGALLGFSLIGFITRLINTRTARF